MITANFPFNQKCVYAPFMALGISSAKTSGISIPFLTGDPRSKSDAQKPANLTVRFYEIFHFRAQQNPFQFTCKLKILGPEFVCCGFTLQ